MTMDPRECLPKESEFIVATSRRALLYGLGALSVAEICKASAANQGESDQEHLVAAFCAAWSTRDVDKALIYLAPDCIYRMTEKTPPAVGHDAIRSALKPTVDRSDAVEFKVLKSASLGPIVINHRIDHFAASVRPLIWEGVGVFYVRGRAIAEWSDYTIRIRAK